MNEADDWTRPLKLSREARKTLYRMGKARASPTVLYGLDQELCEHALRKIVDPLLESAGLKPRRVDQYHWFLRELARLLRTRYGHELAFNIELMMRKWSGYGLSPQVMGFLVTLIDRELRVLAGEAYEPDEEPEKKPGKPESEADDVEEEETADSS